MGRRDDSGTHPILETDPPTVKGTPRTVLQVDDLIEGRYTVQRFIARGGNCEVYEVEDGLVRERVALKILRPKSSRQQDANERFRREIQLARDRKSVV